MPKTDAKDIIDKLNSDLSGELTAIIQYLQHSYMIKGLIREPISERLEEISEDEMKHAKELSDRIVALGGVPTVKVERVIQLESIEEMLESDLELEKKALKDYIEHRNYFEKIGEVGTALIIENIIVDEQHHSDVFTRLLMKQKERKGKR